MSCIAGDPLHQASAVFDRFRLRPRLALPDGASHYVYVWVTGDGGGDPHGNWLPYDWFSAMETPIPGGRFETAVVDAAVEAFARLPDARRRELAGF